MQTPDHLSSLITHQRASFLQPTNALYENLLQLATRYLDPLARDVSEIQSQRQVFQRQNKSRKRRANNDTLSDEGCLRIKRVHIDGFPVEQVWQQSKRVIDAAADEVERYVSRPDVSDSVDGLSDDDINHKTHRPSASDSDDNSDYEAGDDDEISDAFSDEGEDPISQIGEATLLEGSDSEDIGDPGELYSSAETSDEEGMHQETFIKDKHGLNDGFFSIDDFNKKTQFLESQDQRGDPDDGAASDEEDVDWAADPLSAVTSSVVSQGRKAQKRKPSDEDLDSDDEDDGPTFGNADLNAPDNESDADMINGQDLLDDSVNGLDGDFNNTNDIMYHEFFAPPATKGSKRRQHKDGAQRPKTSVRKAELARENLADDEIERAMNGVHRDIFDDEPSDMEGDGDDMDDIGTEHAAGNSNLSTHERRQLALRAQIRRLEAENVANKPWAMTGETVAPARPQNALLEEDLEFERAGKPVPIITSEISESIEELIKRRILNKDFDEVIRRRPNELNAGPDSRRGRLQEEISDSKPLQGLAEEYEQEYLRKSDPNFVDHRSEALKAKHREIEEQWKQVSAQLDSLSNWHYKPRPAAANLEVRVDAPSIMMEDAQPATAGGIGGDSMLAPQEIYQPGENGKREGEILTKGGTAVAREEMSREDSKRQRRRKKERMRKSETNKPRDDGSGSKDTTQKQGKERARTVAKQLQKSGVKVINRKGEVRDSKGNASTLENGDHASYNGAGSLKL